MSDHIPKPFNLNRVLWFAELLFYVLQSQRGTTSNEENLLPRWKESSEAIKSSAGSIVLHLGKLPIGLCKHRSLLFKVCLLFY